MTNTATRTATGITVTLPDHTVTLGGCATATHVVVGQWDAEHGGAWNLSTHKTGEAARKAANGRRFQTAVRVLEVTAA